MTKPSDIKKIQRCGWRPKKKIVTAVEPVFLPPLMDQLIGFGQVYALTLLHHLLTSYRAIDEIDLEENAAKMIEPYDPAKPLAILTENWKREEN